MLAFAKILLGESKPQAVRVRVSPNPSPTGSYYSPHVKLGYNISARTSRTDFLVFFPKVEFLLKQVIIFIIMGERGLDRHMFADFCCTS